MKLFITMILCLIGLNTIAAINTQEEINDIVNSWETTWNISFDVNERFFNLTGANPEGNITEFNANWTIYVANWKVGKTVKVAKAVKAPTTERIVMSLKANNDLITIAQEKINKQVNDWATTWNIPVNQAANRFFSLTGANPIVNNINDVNEFYNSYDLYVASYETKYKMYDARILTIYNEEEMQNTKQYIVELNQTVRDKKATLYYKNTSMAIDSGFIHDDAVVLDLLAGESYRIEINNGLIIHFTVPGNKWGNTRYKF